MKTPNWIKILAIVDLMPDNYRAHNWADRLQVCYSCDSMKENTMFKTNVCGECHCIVDKKTLIKTESCPLGKWT